MKAYKGFNNDMTCRGFQFEVGKTYIHDGDIKLCESGFHSCEAPLDVFNFYPPTALFAEVELDGVSEETHKQDTKRVSKSLIVKAAIDIAGLVKAQVEWCSKNSNAALSKGDYSTAASSGNSSTAASSGYYSKAASSGNYSTAASSGNCSSAVSSGNSSTAASSGNCSKAASSGNYSSAVSSGNSSTAASSGNSSTAASSGYYSKAASSGNCSSAVSSGNCSKAASSGNYSKAASSGNCSSAVSSGNCSSAESNGKQTIAMVAGIDGRARAGVNGAFALPWLDGEQVRIAVGIIGENVKADVWYYVKDGALIENTAVYK